MKRLLITDLDNTLYDWVSFYARAFDSMVDALVSIVGVSRDQLLDEFKSVHQSYGNSEQPFAALELPAVQAAFPNLGRDELAKALESAFIIFNDSRRIHLRLYDGVADTLHALLAGGITVVGHTEAIAVNAWYRLRTLDVADSFTRLYALEGRLLPHPSPGHVGEHGPPPAIVQSVPRAERKPNPTLLHDICKREGVAPDDACYIGDSLTRDISMAKEAGITAVWARYGLRYSPDLWKTLVRVTHWTAEDVAREAELRERAEHVRPDFTIDNFADILPIMR